MTARRKLDAFFYQIGTIENPPYHDLDGMIAFLQENGFPTSRYEAHATTYDEIVQRIDAVEAQRESLDFLIDGAVVKVCDLQTRQAMGNTEKFPRWSVAYKFAAEENTATLLDVTWELGRTGKLTPLAHLTPTDIGGVTVKRATLNNFGDIQRKRVAIGCEVWIRRSNDVIPEIMGRVGEAGPGETPIQPPTVCPACGQPLVERGAHLFCMNRQTCKPQAVARLAHFAGRNAMDIDTFSEKTAELLYDKLGVRDCADLYRLTADDLLPLEGFQQKRADNLIAALDKSRHCALDAFLFALGIPNVGRKTARDLAQHFGSLERLKSATVEELTAIPDVGDIVAASVVEFFSFPENLEMIRRLLDAGVTPQHESDALSDALAGKTVVVTGTLPTLSRDEAEALIARHGGRAAGSVSKRPALCLRAKKPGASSPRPKVWAFPSSTRQPSSRCWNSCATAFASLPAECAARGGANPPAKVRASTPQDLSPARWHPASGRPFFSEISISAMPRSQHSMDVSIQYRKCVPGAKRLQPLHFSGTFPAPSSTSCQIST